MWVFSPDFSQVSKYAEIGPGASTRKFLVSHEVGHWINREWVQNNMGYNNGTWTANSGDPDCAFAGVAADTQYREQKKAACHYAGECTCRVRP